VGQESHKSTRPIGAHEAQERGPEKAEDLPKLLTAEAGIDVLVLTSLGLIVLFPADIGVTTGPP
jgi:hypothetical protein